ncbi:MAG TPA: VanR-ABDEGLN family response regulator transcription factor [Candidatus Merdivicinus excrementipullorum]|uniref:Stage 0 sporulation protein A homolog n=1 Tax=Candidatus Merdivicinus excrementipullorum TaxID=2840867 RepID=A0A9D1JZB0_9FIRM|nr:VanR-ABDEGLN family response regulator transcription factor [Candidatus Merdivicinus excrementipullorum]
MTILVADDEKEIADLVELYLKNEGYDIRKFHDGLSAWQDIQENPPDLAILDVMMPGLDGFALCQKIREKYNFPVIMLTAKVEGMDKINGLSLGADDYVTKPFNPLEVVARVKAQLRRYTHYNQESQLDSRDVIDFSGLIINRKTHECTLDERTLELTPTEFDILWLLCENRGRVISSEQLFEQVWGEKYLNSNNTVMVHIRHLREKMGEPFRNPRFIKTVWGVGYKIE